MSGPLPAALDPFAGLASKVYGRIVARRNRRYDRAENVRRVAVPVISIGNLSTGGVGKSPMVAFLARMLMDAGHHPAIAMRGYGAEPGTAGDEELEYRWRLPDVPVVADPKRFEALSRFLPSRPEIDVVLLDDGFQHRGLHRDLDLLLIDAAGATLDDRLLPAGHLREPVASAARADAVVITHAAAVDEALAAAVTREHGHAPIAWTRHAWTGLLHCDATGESTREAAWLAGRRIVTLLGVGRPARVRDQLERAGATIVADVPARDHERFDRAKIAVARGLADGADALVMTAKDWVKARPLIDLGDWPVPVVIPELTIEFIDGEDHLRTRVLDSLSAALAAS